MSVLSTQSLLFAVGLGAGSIPLAAALNWVIKDGLGQLGGVLYAARVNNSFDSNPRRWCFLAGMNWRELEGIGQAVQMMGHWRRSKKRQSWCFSSYFGSDWRLPVREIGHWEYACPLSTVLVYMYVPLVWQLTGSFHTCRLWFRGCLLFPLYSFSLLSAYPIISPLSLTLTLVTLTLLSQVSCLMLRS